MSKCVIKLDIPQLNLVKYFDSNEALDGWLWDHRGLVTKAIDGTITYDLDKPLEQQNAEVLVDQMDSRGKEVSNAKKNNTVINFGTNDRQTSPVTVDIKALAKYIGRRNDSGLYLELLKDYYINRRKSDTPDKVRAGIGTDFELAFDHIAKGEDYASKAKVIKDEVLVKSLTDKATAVYNWLIQQHTVRGIKPILKREVVLTPLEYSKDFMSSLRLAASAKVVNGELIEGIELPKAFDADKNTTFTPSAEDINAVLGRADVIVIDADGNLHLYDFKTSANDITLQSHPDYGLQVASYGQVITQRGGHLVTRGIIPINVLYKPGYDPNNLAESSVDGFSFNPDKIITLNDTDEVSRLASEWFPSRLNIESGNVTKTNEIIERCFPGGTLTTQERNLKLEVESEYNSKRVSTIPENDTSYRAGNRIRYRKSGFLRPKERAYIDARTEEELKKRIASWINDYNERAANLNAVFANDLRKVLKSGSISGLSTIASNINASDPSFIISAFGRYVSHGWELISDDAAIANGYFLFQKGDLLEEVVLSTHNLFNQIPFDHGKTTRKYTSILGNFIADDQGVDSRWTFKNFFGFMEILKGVIFIGQHPEWLKDKKINKVSAISFLSPGYLEESNEKIIENYIRLGVVYQHEFNEMLPIVHINTEFTTDTQSFVNQARDLMTRSHDADLREVLRAPAFKDTKDEANLSCKQIMNMINALRYKQSGGKLTKIDSADFNKEEWKALQYLFRAYLSLKGYSISPDIRTGPYTNSGPALDGHMSSPAADSPSAVLRALHEATMSWIQVSRTQYIEYTKPWKKAVIDFYNSLGHNQFWGGEYGLYDRFFEHVGDKLNAKFVLKRGEMSTKEENAILNLFFKAIERFRYGNDPKKIERAKENGEFYEVPLVISHGFEKLQKRGFSKSILDTMKKDYLVYRDFMLGVDMSAAEYKKLENIDDYILPEIVFNSDERLDRLTPKDEKDDPTTKYTTDLDYLFNLIAAEGIKRENSPQMLMVSSAIRGVVAYMHFSGANFGEKFENSLREYIKSKVFNRPLIEEGEERLQAAVNVIKGLTSYLTLAASGKAFVRENITGILQGFEKTKLAPFLARRINVDDYVAALNDIIVNCYKNADVMSFHRQLNAIFGTANFSSNEMAENSVVKKLGIKNFELSDLFFTATWPDFLHRNAIVIAYLKGIGAYDAYSMVDGFLTYDMKKDKRFQTFLKYKREEVPDSEAYKWDQEYNLYKDQYESWKRNGWSNLDGTEFKFGDPLPQALSPRDVGSLKEIADRLYGNYDPDTQSLMRQKLFGSLFLQFRTYGLSRAKQFFDGSHDTNDIHMENLQILNDKNELEDLYLVENPNKEAVMEGKEMAYVPTVKSKVTPEQIRSGKATAVRVPVGTHVSGGNVQNIINLMTTLWIYKNQDEFEEMWNNNPEYKASIYMMLIETFGMMLLAFLINSLYKGALQGDYEEIDWLTQWTYNVAIGVTQDGPIWSVIQSIIGDGAPPMLGILQNFTNNITSVITGKKDFMYGLVNSIGATRELAYLFNNR